MLSSKLTTFTALTCLIPSSSCWGALGHRAVAYLASQYLTASAQNYTHDLLNGQDISEAALWADKIRYIPEFRHTAGWHYIDAEDDPPRQCGVRMSRDCDVDNGCVVSAIVNQTARILDVESNHADRGQALRYLLHFFGDIHQPLHTEEESRGGNEIDVLFENKSTNLHSVWDTAILEKHFAPYESHDPESQKIVALEWALGLYAADEHPDASLARECQDVSKAQECALSHANEANKWVCDYVLKDDFQGVEGKELSGDYYQGAVPVVTLLIDKAGRRLGAWINAIAANASDATGVAQMYSEQEDL